MKKLTDILNKIVAKTNPPVRPLDDDPTTIEPSITWHSCCLPGGECIEHEGYGDLFIDMCNSMLGIYESSDCLDRGLDCFEDMFDAGVCVNCDTGTCSRIQDCTDDEQVRDCVESGGSVKCDVFRDDDGNPLYPECSDFLKECNGSADTEPGACCLVAMQPAPPFYLGCVYVQNAQQCTDIGLQSGGLVKATFQEGKICGVRGPGANDPRPDAECPLMWDEYNAPWGACCRRCYETDENGHLKLKSTDCFGSKKSRCLLRNWRDDRGNPGRQHPEYNLGDPYCSYNYGGDNTLCGPAPDPLPPHLEGYKPYTDCDGPYNPGLEDNEDDHPFPWAK